MKNINTSFKCLLSGIVMLISILTAEAQIPQGINYQSLIRDGSGVALVSQPVTLGIRILKGSTSGTAVCSETFSTATDQFGLVNLRIGSLDNISFSAIDWSQGPYYIEIKANGQLMGVTQILSVPYALYSASSGSASAYTETDPVYLAQPAAGISSGDIGNWTAAYGWGNHAVAGYSPSSHVHAGMTTGTGSENKVAFWNSASGLTFNNLLHWDNINARLGIGTAAPLFALQVNGDAGINSVRVGAGGGNRSSNSVLGAQAMESNTTGSNNTAIGNGALTDNTIGTGNTAVGYQVLSSNIAGYRSTAIGYQAMYNAYNTTTARSTFNTAVGYSALRGGTTLSLNSGQYNTAVGDMSLGANTDGNHNTATGSNSLYANTRGADNCAVGYEALFNNSEANENTAVGSGALRYGKNGGNTAVGYQSMYYANNGETLNSTRNTAIGFMSLLGSTNPASNTGFYNTALGSLALKAVTSGSFNTGAGYSALSMNTEGGYNSAFGFSSLSHLDNGDGNVALGYNAGSELTGGSNNIIIGYAAQVGSYANHQIRLGNSNITRAEIQVSWSVTSDLNFKEEVRELPLGLDFVRMLRPVDYVRKNNEERLLEAGFIAQDVKEALDEADYDNTGLLGQDSQGNLTLRYNDLIPVLTKAIQEQNTLIGNQGEEIERLRSELDELKSMLKANMNKTEF